jgi:hypothetical protein
MSFQKYVPDAARQNTTNTNDDRHTPSAVVNTPAAPGAANTNTFFTHCRGRAARTRSIITVFITVVLVPPSPPRELEQQISDPSATTALSQLANLLQGTVRGSELLSTPRY